TDQYGEPMATAVSWSAGGGSIDAGGNYTAGAVPGSYTVTASDGGIAGNATVTVTSSGPPVLGFTDITLSAGTAGPADGGHGVMFADVDDDGLPDLYLTNNFQDTGARADFFFLNQGGGVFLERAQNRGIDDVDGGSHGATWADLDNDGDYDLFNGTTWDAVGATFGFPDHDNVYRNDGSGFFTDVTPPGMQSVLIETRGVTAYDMDGDGDLDLVGVPGSQTPGVNEAFRNDGGLGFSAHTGGALSTAVMSQGVIDTDFDLDGDIDILSANRNGVFAIMRNDGAGNFVQVAPSSLGFAHDAGDGITTADVDGDGDLDMLLVSDGTGHLYTRSAGGSYSLQQSFTRVSGYMGGFADLDNDGDLDLVFAGDNEVFLNQGSGTFVAGPSLPTSGITDPRAVAFADIDLDGDLDLAIAAKRSRNWLVRNDFDGGNWLKVRLTSPQGSAGAFGALTRIYPGGDAGGTLLGLRESRGNHGYLAQDDPVLHFGLGSRSEVDVVVEFADGTQVILSRVAANRIVVVAP
ncbi:MAG: CRTAC1 family protein, partial [Proteobacteria bacterium]|nr:CRTAC1 family protein [Pseudomonadota bacterium]